MELLLLVELLRRLFALALLADIVAVVAVIDLDRAHLLKFKNLRARRVEEFAIVGDDEIARFPGFAEILLQPLDPREVDEVGRLVEEEEVGRGEEDLREGDLGLLSATHLADGTVEQVGYPESRAHTVDRVVIFKSSDHTHVLQRVRVVLYRRAVPAGLECLLRRCELGERCLYLLECRRKLLAHRAPRIGESHLREVAECDIADAVDRPDVLGRLEREYPEEARLAHAIGTDDGDAVVLIDDARNPREDLVTSYLVSGDIDGDVAHGWFFRGCGRIVWIICDKERGNVVKYI